MTTSHPSCARRSAVAAPKPRPAPVTRTTRAMGEATAPQGKCLMDRRRCPRVHGPPLASRDPHGPRRAPHARRVLHEQPLPPRRGHHAGVHQHVPPRARRPPAGVELEPALVAALRLFLVARASSFPVPRIDPRAPRFNQGVVGALSLVAFVLKVPLLLPVLALLLGAGAFLGPQANPLALLWKHAVVPALKLGPPARLKDAAPVRFAQGVGFAFLAAASLALLVFASPLVGWGLALLVAALALLAAVTDVCVGCEVYSLLARWTGRSAQA